MKGLNLSEWALRHRQMIAFLLMLLVRPQGLFPKTR